VLTNGAGFLKLGDAYIQAALGMDERMLTRERRSSSS